MDNMAKVKQGDRSALGISMDTARELAQNLHDDISRLEERLSPVLTQAKAEKESKPKGIDNSSCPLHEEVVQLNNSLGGAGERLTTLINSLRI